MLTFTIIEIAISIFILSIFLDNIFTIILASSFIIAIVVFLIIFPYDYFGALVSFAAGAVNILKLFLLFLGI